MATKNRVVERMCCVTRQTRPVEEMVRFAVSPDNHLVPDIDGKAPGRGVWATLSRRTIEQAVAKGAFQRSLRSAVLVPADLALQVHSRLEERLLGALGLARKAGQLLSGATKVKKGIEAGDVVALFTATDASADGRRKMLGTLRARDDAQKVHHFEILGSDQLGLALGLENVIHAALIEGSASASALKRAQRLARFVSEVENETRKTGVSEDGCDAGFEVDERS